MTVKEIKDAVAHMKDDEEIKFVIRVYDTYGFPDELSVNNVVGIIKNNEKKKEINPYMTTENWNRRKYHRK